MNTEPALFETSQPAAAGMSRIADTLLSQVPQVQEHAVAQHAQEQAANALRDSAGVMFDDAIHAKDTAGQPLKTAAGTWAKRRGRKPGSASAPGPVKSVAASTLGGTSGPVASPVEQARTAGEGACAAFLTLCTLVGGQEWNPMQDEKLGIDEAAHQRKLWGDYFAANNWRDIPPGVAFALGLAGYAGPRFFMPQTRSRLSIAKAWMTEKATKVYLWYVGRRGK